MEIIRVASRAATGYMQNNGFKLSKENYYDLIQDGYLYIINYGNPILENGLPEITTSEYTPEHGKMLYTKLYYNAITLIKKYSFKETSSNAYDIKIETEGKEDNDILEYENDEEIKELILNLSSNKKDQEILKFFSKNTLNNESLELACKKFDVTKDYINQVFETIRNTISIDGYEDYLDR